MKMALGTLVVFSVVSVGEVWAKARGRCTKINEKASNVLELVNGPIVQLKSGKNDSFFATKVRSRKCSSASRNICIDFVGRPGGVLESLSGGTVEMNASGVVVGIRKLKIGNLKKEDQKRIEPLLKMIKERRSKDEEKGYLGLQSYQGGGVMAPRYAQLDKNYFDEVAGILNDQKSLERIYFLSDNTKEARRVFVKKNIENEYRIAKALLVNAETSLRSAKELVDAGRISKRGKMYRDAQSRVTDAKGRLNLAEQHKNSGVQFGVKELEETEVRPHRQPRLAAVSGGTYVIGGKRVEPNRWGNTGGTVAWMANVMAYVRTELGCSGWDHEQMAIDGRKNYERNEKESH